MGFLFCFQGKVHSAKQAAMVTGAFFAIGSGLVHCCLQERCESFGSKVSARSKKLGSTDSAGEFFDPRLISCDECT
jgi:hypothetical protein